MSKGNFFKTAGAVGLKTIGLAGKGLFIAGAALSAGVKAGNEKLDTVAEKDWVKNAYDQPWIHKVKKIKNAAVEAVKAEMDNMSKSEKESK